MNKGLDIKRPFAVIWVATMLMGSVGTLNAAPIGSGPVLSRAEKVEHVLSRLTFGAKPGDAERVAAMGVEAFISEQLDPYSIDDSTLDKKLEKLSTLTLSTPVLAEQYNPPKPSPTPTPLPTPADATPMPVPSPTATPKPTPTPKNPQMVISELQRAKLLRAVYSNRQLYELVVDFWENHFSIYGNKDATRWTMTAFDRDAIRPFALGNFRDLLGATAKSPAMLYYLDNWQSSVVKEYPATKDKPARKSGGINENYARELLELHTMGVGGGYTQKDVQEVARCFTGWSIRKPNEEALFVYNPANHDNGEKTVLGVKIPAGGGIADGERVLDILAKHPKTARFVATNLARRFMGDDPPAIVVDRAAKTFLATDGSITETLRTIITSPQFYAVANYRNKVKSPFEFVASAIRASAAETDGQKPVLDWIAKMGQPVYGRLTPDGYPDINSEWLSNNDLISRFNFASAIGLNNIKGTVVDAIAFASLDSPKARATAARRILGESATEKTLSGLGSLKPDASQPAAIIPTAAKPDDGSAAKKALGGQAIALLLGSPEFQRK